MWAMQPDFSEKSIMVWLSLLGNCGFNTYKALSSEFGSPSEIYDASTAGKLPGSLKRDSKALIDFKDDSLKARAAEICLEADRAGMKIITAEDPDYPEKLINTPYPCPLVLYYYGDMGICSGGDTDICIGIVGSRHCSASGGANAMSYSYDLAAKGITVISGMARGCDGLAHTGALKAGGKTAAVLASGADVIYPPEHKKLYNDIIAKGGCVLSESPPGTIPYKQLFPARNRIIAGLSDGVLVIEAAKKSGALITADRALEADRTVFALPGDVRNPMAYGTNELIRQGAICVSDVNIILDELGLAEDRRCKKRPWNGFAIGLPFPENAVANALIHGAGTVDEIEQVTHIDVGKIAGALTMLEIRGLIRSDGFGIYYPLPEHTEHVDPAGIQDRGLAECG